MNDVLKPEWWFYRLQHTPLEQAAALLVEKCFSHGWRVLVISPETVRRADLDSVFWTCSDTGFLPHARADSADMQASEQPVLITDTTAHNVNKAQIALLVDGADLEADAPFQRCLVMFDDGDAPARQKAQTQFRRSRQAGLVTRFFQQGTTTGWRETVTA